MHPNIPRANIPAYMNKEDWLNTNITMETELAWSSKTRGEWENGVACHVNISMSQKSYLDLYQTRLDHF